MTESLSLSLPAALVLGLAFGAGPCLLTCLPYAGPLLTLQGGRHPVRRQVLPFLAGRLTTYTGLATLAGWGGSALLKAFPQGAVTLLLGGVTVVAGVALWRSGGACRRPVSPNPGAQPVETMQPLRRRQPATPLALYLMGLTLAASPCLPLSTVLAAAAATTSPVLGGGLGLAFGVGAVTVPGLVLAGLAGPGGTRIRGEIGPWLPGARKGGAALLVALGTATALGWVAP